MTEFVQIIEFQTTRIDEVRALTEEFRSSRQAEPDSLAVRGIITADRDRPGTYLNIVQFPSYEVAMANSTRPDTQKMAERMAELCDGPPRFYNLDALEIWGG